MLRARYVLPSLVLFCSIAALVAGPSRPPAADSPQRVRVKRGPQPDGPAEYVSWRNKSLRDETGVIAPDGLMRAKAHVDMMRARGDAPLAGGIGAGTWSSIGPGNIGGRIRALAIDPADPNVIFVGSVSGGIWRTSNGGTSWSPVNDFMANLAVTAIVMVPGTPSTMFAATGEGFYNSDGIRGAGIFRSTNSGGTWAQLPATSSAPAAGQAAADYQYVNDIAVSPDGATLLAATRTGIYRSVTSGDAFARATMVGGSAIAVGLGIVDIDFHPSDSSRAVAATFAGTALYSTDGGATWTLAGGMPGGSSFRRSELAFAPSNGAIVYASVDLDGGSIYKSTDGGQTYVEVFDGQADAALNPLGSQGWYDNLMWVSPTDENFVVWGGIDLFRSTTGGTAWTKMSEWFSHSFSGPTSAHADQHIAVAHPGFNGTSNRIVFFGNDGGIYRAADVATVGGGGSPYRTGWTELNNNLAITQFYGGAGHAASGRVTGGTQDNGTLFFDPTRATPAENWTAPFGGDGGFSAYDSADANYFYGEYVYLTLHRNSSGGAGASQYIYQTIPDAFTTAAEFIAAFVLDPNDNNRLLGASVRLWRSNAVKAPSPSFEQIKAAVSGSDHISAIGVGPGNSDLIYAGHNSGRLYKTTVGTASAATVQGSWSAIDDNGGSNPLPNRRITRITIDPDDNDIVYVTFGGFSGDNIYRSINGGASWANITGPSGGASALPDVPVRDLEIHPDNGNWLYAGTEVGIFVSEDAGTSWSLPHDGPSNVSVDELFFLGTTLYSVTHGRGMFSTPAPTSGSAPTAVNDTYNAVAGMTLDVPAPGVLTNDNSNGGGAMTAQLETNVTTGTLTLNANGGFTYTPAAGFTGAATFTYRAVNTVGAGNAATVTITVTPGGVVPTAVDDSYGTTVGAALNVAAPGVLVNDSSNGGGVMTAQLMSGPSHGSLTLNPDGSFGYTPSAGFTGIDTFSYRAVNTIGPSAPATVTITVSPSSTVQPPINLYASAIAGNLVTLRWTPPASGPTPTGYVLEGGIAPGDVLASVPTGSAAPLFTFTAPSGAFYVRIHTLAGPDRSAASNEIRIFVNVPQSPSPPDSLLAMVNGDALALAWRNTFGGGAATALTLDVSGSLSASLPIPLGESISFGGVPAGSYTLRLRASNASGSSAASNPVSVTIPGACSGTPLVPTNFVAAVHGGLVTIVWDLPASGPAPTGFVLNVSGSFAGAIPTTTRSIGGAVPPGTYTVSVQGTNACGSGPATSPQTITVP